MIGHVRGVRLLRRLLATISLAVGLVLLSPASPATAHAYLTGSNPADGASLTAAPAALRLQFSESVDLAATQIEVVADTGQRVHPRDLRIVRGDDTEEPSSIVADLPRLARGAYRVSWETLSSDDLHRTSGVFSFGIDEVVQRSGFREPAPRAEEVALRWALFACIATALGGLLGARLYRRVDPASPVGRSCLRLAAGGAATGVLVAAGLLADQAQRSGVPFGRLVSGTYGQRWTVRELGLALLVVAAVTALRDGRRRIVAAFTAAGIAAAGIGSALLGHAAAGPGFVPTRVGADALHLVAAATWSGMVMVAAMVIARQRHGSSAAATGREVLRVFAVPAALCVSLVAATGIYLASGVVGSVDAALLTWYGRALLVKTALFGAVALLGLLNHRRLRRVVGGTAQRRTLIAEAVLAALVLGLAAFLTSGQPAREPEFVASGRYATEPFVDARIADLQQRVQIGPNRPGRNVVLVDVLDTRRPAPGPVQDVLVRLVTTDGYRSAPVAADRLAIKGRWSATVDLPAPGESGIEVTVVRPGLRPVRHVFGWVVAGRPTLTRAATVSTAPISGLLRTAAVLLAVLLGVAWCVAALSRRGRRPSGGELAPAGRRPDGDGVDAAVRKVPAGAH